MTLGGTKDGEVAIASAKAAFESWSQSSKEDRIALVERILETYLAYQDKMAEAISTEMGAPIDYATNAQVTAGSYHIENFLMAVKDFEFTRPLGAHAPQDKIAYEPIGVVGLITPWNWPMNQVTLKVIMALLAGCTMVLKPSEIAPYHLKFCKSCMKLARLQVCSIWFMVMVQVLAHYYQAMLTLT